VRIGARLLDAIRREARVSACTRVDRNGSGGGGGGIDKRGNGVAAVRQRCGGAGASKRGKEGRPSMK